MLWGLQMFYGEGSGSGPESAPEPYTHTHTHTHTHTPEKDVKLTPNFIFTDEI